MQSERKSLPLQEIQSLSEQIITPKVLAPNEINQEIANCIELLISKKRKKHSLPASYQMGLKMTTGSLIMSAAGSLLSGYLTASNAISNAQWIESKLEETENLQQESKPLIHSYHAHGCPEIDSPFTCPAPESLSPQICQEIINQLCDIFHKTENIAAELSNVFDTVTEKSWLPYLFGPNQANRFLFGKNDVETPLASFIITALLTMVLFAIVLAITCKSLTWNMNNNISKRRVDDFSNYLSTDEEKRVCLLNEQLGLEFSFPTSIDDVIDSLKDKQAEYTDSSESDLEKEIQPQRHHHGFFGRKTSNPTDTANDDYTPASRPK